MGRIWITIEDDGFILDSNRISSTGFKQALDTFIDKWSHIIYLFEDKFLIDFESTIKLLIDEGESLEIDSQETYGAPSDIPFRKKAILRFFSNEKRSEGPTDFGFGETGFPDEFYQDLYMLIDQNNASWCVTVSLPDNSGYYLGTFELIENGIFSNFEYINETLPDWNNPDDVLAKLKAEIDLNGLEYATELIFRDAPDQVITNIPLMSKAIECTFHCYTYVADTIKAESKILNEVLSHGKSGVLYLIPKLTSYLNQHLDTPEEILEFIGMHETIGDWFNSLSDQEIASHFESLVRQVNYKSAFNDSLSYCLKNELSNDALLALSRNQHLAPDDASELFYHAVDLWQKGIEFGHTLQYSLVKNPVFVEINRTMYNDVNYIGEVIKQSPNNKLVMAIIENPNCPQYVLAKILEHTTNEELRSAAQKHPNFIKP